VDQVTEIVGEAGEGANLGSHDISSSNSDYNVGSAVLYNWGLWR
jgi:hypothetical protein